MRRWAVRAVNFHPWRRPALCAATYLHPLAFRSHGLSTATERAFTRLGPARIVGEKAPIDYARFDDITKPEESKDAWLALLDGALPPHLRDWENAGDVPVLTVVQVAETLLAARRSHGPNPHGLDLLYCLAYERHRWGAASWLIKAMVEKFPARHTRKDDLTKVNYIWDHATALHEFSRYSENAVLESHDPPSPLVPIPSLSALTDDRSMEEVRQDNLGHDVIGQVWLSLAMMTKACAGSDIMPEILEIIAYLHHEGVMPMAIYQSEHRQDRTIIQQPPLLSMLSSRILTSLSDAAWRAHEKLVVHEARARGADYAALRPEVPGSVYRVYITGLRPEVWMELILWSCLHGGWILAGTEILRALCRDRTWKVFSWDEFEQTMLSAGQTSTEEWSQLEHVFKTIPPSSIDAPAQAVAKVDHTVSAEVVNAYIDALPNAVELGSTQRGMPLYTLTRSLHDLKVLLRRVPGSSDLRFGSRSGSWDALIVRVIESQTIVPERDSNETQHLVALSSGFGLLRDEDLTRDLPNYVRDGNLAMQGLLHRALYGQIAAGNYEGALRMFHRMQYRADRDKQASLSSFMPAENTQGVMGSLLENNMFTSNYAGISYPAFSMNLPTTILGSFMELVVEAKHYVFGRWLLNNKDIDGPVITESMYDDEYLQPVIVRLAVETDDKALLSKFEGHGLVAATYRSILDSQVNALGWNNAYRTLKHLKEAGIDWNITNLASVIRLAMIHHARGAAGDAEHEESSVKARNMLQDMCLGRYHGDRERKVRSALAVLSAVDVSWARFNLGLRTTASHFPFILDVRAFNRILEGAVLAYGSTTGQRLLQLFWPFAVRNSDNAALRLDTNHSSGPARRLLVRPNVLSSADRQRIVVEVPHEREQKDDLVMYGALSPNVETILIIVRQALEEVKQASGMIESPNTKGKASSPNLEPQSRKGEQDSDFLNATPQTIVRWAVRRMAELPEMEGSPTEALDGTLSFYGLDDVRTELPAILRSVEADVLADLEEDVVFRSTSDDFDDDIPMALP